MLSQLRFTARGAHVLRPTLRPLLPFSSPLLTAPARRYYPAELADIGGDTRPRRSSNSNSRGYHTVGMGLDMAGDYGHSYGHGHGGDSGGAPRWRATTILAVRKAGRVVVIGDGQVSLGASVVKPNARKVRRIGGGAVVVGFAGATADAFTLLERLEAKVDEFPGQLLRAGVETAKLWRTDKYLKHLEAMLIAADEHVSICLTGNGDVIEPHDGLLAIGSGGNYALAAARALVDVPGQDALAIARKAMGVAADMCVYTNHNWVIEEIEITAKARGESEEAAKEGDVLSKGGAEGASKDGGAAENK